MNIIETLENEQIEKLRGGKPVPDFSPGDTLKVHVKVVEGSRERIQVFEGVCIAIKNAGLHSAFTVRKISYGEGVERVFPLHSPRIDAIEVTRQGDVRRAKLYYLRTRAGKAARIAEKVTWSRENTPSASDKNTGSLKPEAPNDNTVIADPGQPEQNTPSTADNQPEAEKKES